MKMVNDIAEFKNNNLIKKYTNDAGLDIRCPFDISIPSGGSFLVFTRLAVSIPKGHVGLIKSRSSMAVHKNIEVSNAGVIDTGYTGEIRVLLRSFSQITERIKKGERIAQLITLIVNLSLYAECKDLPDTYRGNNGLGSTGL